MYTPQNITILLITLASFFPLYGQNKDNDQDLELVKVASLNTIEANKEFQKNVQLVQQQRALAVQILSKLEKVQDKDEHDELQKQLNSLQKKLNDNNLEGSTKEIIEIIESEKLFNINSMHTWGSNW